MSCGTPRRPACLGAPVTHEARVEELLEAQLDLLRQLLQAVTQPARGVSTLSRGDRERVARILPAVAGALGSEPFASRDLAADVPALRVVLRGLSVKQIGRLLSRAEGVPIDGWILERCGKEINVALWRVLATVSNRLESGTAIPRSALLSVGER